MQTLYPILMKFLSNNPEFISNGLKFISNSSKFLWVTPSLYQTQQPKVYMRHPNFVSIGTAQSVYKTPSSLYQTEQPKVYMRHPKFVSNRTALSLYETPPSFYQTEQPKVYMKHTKFVSNRTAHSLCLAAVSSMWIHIDLIIQYSSKYFAHLNNFFFIKFFKKCPLSCSSCFPPQDPLPPPGNFLCSV